MYKNKKMFFNPFTLRVTQKSIVCYFHTFENNLGIKQKLFEKYYQNCQACFGRSKCEWVQSSS